MKSPIKALFGKPFSYFSFLLTFATASAMANNHLPSRPIHTRDAEVRYIPGNSGELRFNVRYNNVLGSRFSVAILDDAGNQLYQDIFTDKNFDKTFLLADGELAGKLIFVIRNFADNTIQRFEVHAVDRMVKDVEVKEMN